jgi:hypothetical protein
MARQWVRPDGDDAETYTDLAKQVWVKRERYLNVLDAVISLNPDDSAYLDELREILEMGASAWTISPHNHSLTRRVDPTAQAAAMQAMAPSDAASAELGAAWRAVYGQNPSPSQAWHLAIKACEHVLKPLVSPANNRTTLGSIIRDLRAQSAKWQLVVPGKDESHSIDPLVAMLDLVWPNHDRHGDGSPKTVDLEAAQALVHLAVTIVQWVRSGALVKKT